MADARHGQFVDGRQGGGVDRGLCIATQVPPARHVQRRGASRDDNAKRQGEDNRNGTARLVTEFCQMEALPLIARQTATAGRKFLADEQCFLGVVDKRFTSASRSLARLAISTEGGGF